MIKTYSTTVYSDSIRFVQESKSDYLHKLITYCNLIQSFDIHWPIPLENLQCSVEDRLKIDVFWNPLFDTSSICMALAVWYKLYHAWIQIASVSFMLGKHIACQNIYHKYMNIWSCKFAKSLTKYHADLGLQNVNLRYVNNQGTHLVWALLCLVF